MPGKPGLGVYLGLSLPSSLAAANKVVRTAAQMRERHVYLGVNGCWVSLHLQPGMFLNRNVALLQLLNIWFFPRLQQQGTIVAYQDCGLPYLSIAARPRRSTCFQHNLNGSQSHIKSSGSRNEVVTKSKSVCKNILPIIEAARTLPLTPDHRQEGHQWYDHDEPISRNGMALCFQINPQISRVPATKEQMVELGRTTSSKEDHHFMRPEMEEELTKKGFLNLPRYTPGYIIRLETGRISLSVRALKLTLKYWLRVLNMISDRLPRTCVCFNRTRELSNASSTPIGFIKKLTNLLNKNGSPALVSCDDPETLRSAITGLLKTVADQSIQNDFTRMDKSRLYSHYKDIHISFMTEGYLLGDFPFPVVRLLAQVRILSSFFRENHTKMLCGEDPICTFCNSKLKNEITPYIFDCSAQKEEPLCSKLGNSVLHFHQ
ncbi:hypothetical protein LAZ67_9001798 [Cordylochernes scorpioides]|uniref:Uncharacterized protein n=1 Tax=Cordylochernes scorpioides TaxID=51811 RepID=A0ABY6KTT0_9ARAC|nr:hypothetical protein LAZ67_9001798 [Cordylochernes scorpioides]